MEYLIIIFQEVYKILFLLIRFLDNKPFSVYTAFFFKL